MRASGGQTIRCGESRKKEAEVEGRSFDTDSGVPGLSTPDYGRLRPAIWAGCDGRGLLRSSTGGDIGDIRCQWEVRVRGLK